MRRSTTGHCRDRAEILPNGSAGAYGVAEEYRYDDADVVVVAMGTLGKEAEVAVDLLRNEGVKAGSLRVRWLRPFPDLDLAGRDIVVIDRDYSFGFGGVLAQITDGQVPGRTLQRDRRSWRPGGHL